MFLVFLLAVFKMVNTKFRPSFIFILFLFGSALCRVMKHCRCWRSTLHFSPPCLVFINSNSIFIRRIDDVFRGSIGNRLLSAVEWRQQRRRWISSLLDLAFSLTFGAVNARARRDYAGCRRTCRSLVWTKRFLPMRSIRDFQSRHE